jgi:hypothetical protein
VFRSSGQSVVEKGISGIEMRTAPRSRILQRCFVQPAKSSSLPAWCCIAYNISATGIGVTLPVKPQKGTVLSIQAWGLPRACTIQARVVRVKLVDFLWFTGCEIMKRLSDTELRIWCSGPLDWLEDQRS